MSDGGEKWEEIKLPAIDNRGGALWPDRFPIDELENIRKSTDDRTWFSLYQQEPRENINPIFEDPKINIKCPKDCRLFAYFDPAEGGQNDSALSIGGIHNGKIYIKYGYIWNANLDKTYELLLRYLIPLDINGNFYIEDNVAQKAIIDVMKLKGLKADGITNTKPKHIRILKYLKSNWDNIHFSPDVEYGYLEQILNYQEPKDYGTKKYYENVDAPDSLAGLLYVLVGDNEFKAATWGQAKPKKRLRPVR
jgi:hypothetical protein